MLMKLSLLKVLHVSFQERDVVSLCFRNTYTGAPWFCTMISMSGPRTLWGRRFCVLSRSSGKARQIDVHVQLLRWPMPFESSCQVSYEKESRHRIVHSLEPCTYVEQTQALLIACLFCSDQRYRHTATSDANPHQSLPPSRLL